MHMLRVLVASDEGARKTDEGAGKKLPYHRNNAAFQIQFKTVSNGGGIPGFYLDPPSKQNLKIK